MSHETHRVHHLCGRFRPGSLTCLRSGDGRVARSAAAGAEIGAAVVSRDRAARMHGAGRSRRKTDALPPARSGSGARVIGTGRTGYRRRTSIRYGIPKGSPRKSDPSERMRATFGQSREVFALSSHRLPRRAAGPTPAVRPCVSHVPPHASPPVVVLRRRPCGVARFAS